LPLSQRRIVRRPQDLMPVHPWSLGLEFNPTRAPYAAAAGFAVPEAKPLPAHPDDDLQIDPRQQTAETALSDNVPAVDAHRFDTLATRPALDDRHPIRIPLAHAGTRTNGERQSIAREPPARSTSRFPSPWWRKRDISNCASIDNEARAPPTGSLSAWRRPACLFLSHRLPGLWQGRRPRQGSAVPPKYCVFRLPHRPLRGPSGPGRKRLCPCLYPSVLRERNRHADHIVQSAEIH
jgi:hypothetical protein